MKTRIDTALSPELALKRLREDLRSRDDPATSDLEATIYGQVDGRHFSARRSAFPRSSLQGELAGVVEAGDHGSTVHVHAMGADWAAIYAGAGLAAALFVVFLLGESTDPIEQFVLTVLGGCCLGAGVYALGSVYADWRFLFRHLQGLFRDVAP